MTDDFVAILVPVLNRPERVTPFLDSLRSSVRNHVERCEVLWIVDESDKRERDRIYGSGVALPVPDGTNYAAKINAGYRATDAPWLFQAADDLNFHLGWLDYALWRQRQTSAAVVGTNDLCNDRTMRGDHSTHSLVQREYLDALGGVVDEGPGSFMHEGYAHEYSDDEMIQTAMHRGEYVHAFGAIVEHMHPLCGKGAEDATYELGRTGTLESRRLFAQRCQLWGGDNQRRRQFRRPGRVL